MTDRTPAGLTQTGAWQRLQEHHQAVSERHLTDWFAADNQRFQQMHCRAANLLLDYSKNRIDAETIGLLTRLAEERGLAQQRQRLFAGAEVNNTERRAVLHTALRANNFTNIQRDNIEQEIADCHAQMRTCVEAVRSGQWRGGLKITDVVNIGIGGSDLGPKMIYEALSAQPAALRVHYVSNIDGSAISQTLAGLNPATTLFIVTSKSFTTQETAVNSATAQRWFEKGAEANSSLRFENHFIAITANPERAQAAGFAEDNIFAFWDWVGGRYSLWSAVGLSIALAYGWDSYIELLAGAEEMDRHFESAPFEQNMPVLMALLGVWYANFFDAPSIGVMPYDENLKLLPAYLQQLDMESNGKGCLANGGALDYSTGPILWGSQGTNGQHAFFQLLHQGTHLVPIDFIGVLKPSHPLADQHEQLLANCFAQSRALAFGRDEAAVRAELEAAGESEAEIERLLPHKLFHGNRPSNTLLLPELNPRSIGSLVALYEHKVFVQGVLWGINSFDQWGVELGKKMANEILEQVQSGGEGAFDSSTAGLLNEFAQTKSSSNDQ